MTERLVSSDAFLDALLTHMIGEHVALGIDFEPAQRHYRAIGQEISTTTHMVAVLFGGGTVEYGVRLDHLGYVCHV